MPTSLLPSISSVFPKFLYHYLFKMSSLCLLTDSNDFATLLHKKFAKGTEKLLDSDFAYMEFYYFTLQMSKFDKLQA